MKLSKITILLLPLIAFSSFAGANCDLDYSAESGEKIKEIASVNRFEAELNMSEITEMMADAVKQFESTDLAVNTDAVSQDAISCNLKKIHLAAIQSGVSKNSSIILEFATLDMSPKLIRLGFMKAGVAMGISVGISIDTQGKGVTLVGIAKGGLSFTPESREAGAGTEKLAIKKSMGSLSGYLALPRSEESNLYTNPQNIKGGNLFSGMEGDLDIGLKTVNGRAYVSNDFSTILVGFSLKTQVGDQKRVIDVKVQELAIMKAQDLVNYFSSAE